tara:strand:- start:2259 stop:2492 length:234 start_codon:yes stop_codon:yes gene_type:complete
MSINIDDIIYQVEDEIEIANNVSEQIQNKLNQLEDIVTDLDTSELSNHLTRLQEISEQLERIDTAKIKALDDFDIGY